VVDKVFISGEHVVVLEYPNLVKTYAASDLATELGLFRVQEAILAVYVL
jgi:hypothetical protein